MMGKQIQLEIIGAIGLRVIGSKVVLSTNHFCKTKTTHYNEVQKKACRRMMTMQRHCSTLEKIPLSNTKPMTDTTANINFQAYLHMLELFVLHVISIL